MADEGVKRGKHDGFLGKGGSRDEIHKGSGTRVQIEMKGGR